MSECMSMDAIEALTQVRNMAAQKSARWKLEIQRADSANEREWFRGMARAADLIELSVVDLIDRERAKPSPTDGTSAPISKGQAGPNSPKEEA